MTARPMVVEGGVEIGAPPQRVFEALADPATWFKIDPTLLDVMPREPIGLGSTGTMRNRRGPGLTATASWATTEFVPGARLTQHLTGFGYELTESVVLAADAEGTQVIVVDTLVPTSFVGRVMVALSRGIMERDMKSRCAKLKALLEADPAPRGSVG